MRSSLCKWSSRYRLLDPRPNGASPDAALSARATQEMQTQISYLYRNAKGQAYRC